MPCKRRRKKFDPKALPDPMDFRGYDHTMVRVVPEIDRLIEIQVRLPAHIWDDVYEATKSFKDLEVDMNDRRMVRRGRKNKATNIFLDSD